MVFRITANELSLLHVVVILLLHCIAIVSGCPSSKINNKMKGKIEVLKEVAVELDRFKKKLALAIKEQSEKGNHSSKHYAASKRAALDLKNELTKLTQDSKYRWSS